MTLRISAERKSFRLHAGLNAADFARAILRNFAGVAHRVRHHLKILAERLVPRHGPGAHQCLSFPNVTPLLVIGAIGVEGPNERPVFALGAQSRIQVERKSDILAESGDVVHHFLGDRVSVVTRSGIAKNPQHVGVGREPEFLATETPHGDDRELDSVRSPTGEVDERLERRRGDVGQRPPQFFDRDHSEN